MGQLNRKNKKDNKNSVNFLCKMNQMDEHVMFSYSAIYLLLAASVLVSYMIWYYYGYGQWTMDGVMQGFMKNIRAPWLDKLFKGITATGETLPVVLVTLLIAIALILKKKFIESGIFAFYMLGV